MPDEPTTLERDRSRFGPNAWLLDELYGAYLGDPESVGEAWREFFEGYRPRGGVGRAQVSEAPSEPPAQETRAEDAELVPLAGAAAIIARRMDESLAVP